MELTAISDSKEEYVAVRLADPSDQVSRCPGLLLDYQVGLVFCPCSTGRKSYLLTPPSHPDQDSKLEFG